jgi:hypothetical protein
MRRAFLGAALVVAGIAAFIEASRYQPLGCERGERCAQASHLSATGYDLLHIGAWALVIFGALLIVVGLIDYWSTQLAR